MFKWRLSLLIIALLIGWWAYDLRESSAQDRHQAQVKFDFNSGSPIDYLKFLRSLAIAGINSTSVGVIPKGWIKSEHLPQLISQLESNEKCANVASVLSSYLDPKPSTCEREAAFLIQGFRNGGYPPQLNSTRSFDFSSIEMRDWYENELKKPVELRFVRFKDSNLE